MRKFAGNIGWHVAETTQITMLTVYQDPETIFQVLAAGAHGYLVKPVMRERLLEAIREIWAGEVPMSRTIARKVIEVFHRPPRATTVGLAIVDAGLGPRKQQVLEHVVAGLSYKEIADEFQIEVATVGTNVQRIYEKLHLRNGRTIISHFRSNFGN
jgi:DNA-binding NarL/FixJ family response regulator